MWDARIVLLVPPSGTFSLNCTLEYSVPVWPLCLSLLAQKSMNYLSYSVLSYEAGSALDGFAPVEVNATVLRISQAELSSVV